MAALDNLGESMTKVKKTKIIYLWLYDKKSKLRAKSLCVSFPTQKLTLKVNN